MRSARQKGVGRGAPAKPPSKVAGAAPLTGRQGVTNALGVLVTEMRRALTAGAAMQTVATLITSVVLSLVIARGWAAKKRAVERAQDQVRQWRGSTARAAAHNAEGLAPWELNSIAQGLASNSLVQTLGPILFALSLASVSYGFRNTLSASDTILSRTFHKATALADDIFTEAAYATASHALGEHTSHLSRSTGFRVPARNGLGYLPPTHHHL
jgi:hypothetical protein